MNEIPVATIKQAGYENIIVDCPSCGKESIFNRASDLHSFEPVAGLNVSCQDRDCRMPFRMISDSINCPHEMLILDCYELLKRKHYMNCVLTICQAYEVFFSLYLSVELLYKPFARDAEKDIEQLTSLAAQLIEKVRRHSFESMRALFLQQVCTGNRPKNLAEAEAALAGLSEQPGDPKDTDLRAIEEEQLVNSLIGVKRTSINRIRNDVVHKLAFRPAREAAETALEEARSLLFPLTALLGLRDDINHYACQK